MVTIAYAAPFFLPTTVRFLQSVAELPGVRVGLISQDPIEKLSPLVRERLAAHYRVKDGLDPQQIADAVRGMAPRLGRPDLLLGTLEQLQVPLAEVREALGIPGMRPGAAHNFRDKSRMKDVLRAAGLPVARHRLVESVEAGAAFGREVGYPLVVKPPDGAGAKATYRANSEAELLSSLGSLRPGPGRPVLCEEFIRGREGSFEVMSVAGEPAWYSATRYEPAPLHVLENPWIQWTITLPREIDDPADAPVRKLGFAALKALGMTSGLSHMEWFRRADGSVAISEIGARPPGAQIVSLMSYAHDADLYRGWAGAVVHGQFTPPARRYAAGAAFLRGQGQGRRVVAVHGLDQAQREIGGLVVEAQLPQVGQGRADTYEGEGYALLRHPETSVVDRALMRLISLVRVELG